MARNRTRISRKENGPFVPLNRTSPVKSRGFGAPIVGASALQAKPESSGLDLSRVAMTATGMPVQTKLTIGQPGDKYEQEADAVAAKVVDRINSPQPQQVSPGGAGAVQRQENNSEEEEIQQKPLAESIQRQEVPEEEEAVQQKPLTDGIQRQEMPEEEELQQKPLAEIQRQEAAPEEEEAAVQMSPELQRETAPQEEEEAVQAKPDVQREAMPEEEEAVQPKLLVQRKAGGAMAASQQVESGIAGARGGGQALDDGTRGQMEGAFGADFSGVRVHTDERSDQLNRSLQSRAFATGQDIFFKRGEFNPGSRGGQELLAHELTHVVQQKGLGQQASRAIDWRPERSKRADVKNITGMPSVQRFAAAAPAAVPIFTGLTAESLATASSVVGLVTGVGSAAAGAYSAVKRGVNGFGSLQLPQKRMSGSDKKKLELIAQFRIINEYVRRYFEKTNQAHKDKTSREEGHVPNIDGQKPLSSPTSQPTSAPARPVDSKSNPDTSSNSPRITGSPTATAIDQNILNASKKSIEIDLKRALENVSRSEAEVMWGEDDTRGFAYKIGGSGTAESIGVTGFLQYRNIETSILKEKLKLSPQAKASISGDVSGEGKEFIIHMFFGGSVSGKANWSAWDNLTVNFEPGKAQESVHKENGSIKFIIRTHWYWNRWGPDTETKMQNDLHIKNDGKIYMTVNREDSP